MCHDRIGAPRNCFIRLHASLAAFCARRSASRAASALVERAAFAYLAHQAPPFSLKASSIRSR